MHLLLFARGLVVAVLMAAALLMLKRMGWSNTWASVATAMLALPFAARYPLRWLMERLPGKNRIVLAQMAFAAMMCGVGMNISPDGGGWVACLLLVMAAVVGAFHDVAADGYCRLWLADGDTRRIATGMAAVMLAVVFGLGTMLVVAGDMEVMLRESHDSWGMAFMLMAALAFAVAMACLWRLPDNGKMAACQTVSCGREDVVRWWQQPRQWVVAAIWIIFPLHEWMLWKGTLLFLSDPGSIGGLSLGPQEVGFVQAIVATFALIAGSGAGCWCLMRYGLRRCLWPMVAAATLPDAFLLLLALAMPDNLWYICACLVVESAGCGFGLAGFMAFLTDNGRSRGMTAHVDSCLMLVALSMVAAGIVTGGLQDYLGYRKFYLIVVILAVASALVLPFARKWLRANAINQ